MISLLGCNKTTRFSCLSSQTFSEAMSDNTPSSTESDPPSPDYRPIENFIEHEAFSRYPTNFPPTDLFDWERVTGRKESSLQLTGEEEQKKMLRRGLDALADRQRSEDQLKATYISRKKKMISEEWTGLLDHYHDHGYQALQAIKSSLESRIDRESERLSETKQQHRYFELLALDCKHFASQEGSATAISETIAPGEKKTGERFICRRPSKRYVVLEMMAQHLNLEDLDPDVLEEHPFEVQLSMPDLSTTWNDALSRANRHKSTCSRRTEEWGGLQDLMHLRWSLAGRMLWMIDLGVRPDDAPLYLSTVPEDLKNKKRAIRHCLTVISVLKDLDLASDDQYPTQSDLTSAIRERYSVAELSIAPRSVVDQATDFIREQSDLYQHFRPDFYWGLEGKAGRLLWVADELDLDLPAPKDS